MPGVQFTVEAMIAEGDWVAIRVRVSGTQPDGKPLSFITMNMVHFVNGQWAEEWELTETTGDEVMGSDIGQQ
jgi:predicted ester cyclase